MVGYRATWLLAVALGGCSDKAEPAMASPPAATEETSTPPGGTTTGASEFSRPESSAPGAASTEPQSETAAELQSPTATGSVVTSNVETTSDTGSSDADTAEVESSVSSPDGGPTNGVAGCVSREVTTLQNGTLTAYPNISVDIYPSSFRVTTINFIVTEDGDERGPLLDVYAEIQNVSGGLLCNILPDLSFSAGDLVGIIEFPAYRQVSDIVDYTTLADCLGVGQVGILRANARGVTAQALDQAGSLFIDATPYDFGFSYELPPEEPEVDAVVTQSASGWMLSGTVTPGADIHNYGMLVFPRDTNGLLTGDRFAAPGDLGTLFGGAAVGFESEPSPCPFTDYAFTHTWILGP